MNKILAILCLIFLIIVVVLGVGYINTLGQLAEARAQTVQQQLNDKTIAFMVLFIDKVLGVSGEVDFDTRLNMENRVRELQNPDILAAWQKFTNSQTEREAQANVRGFLQILVKNLKRV